MIFLTLTLYQCEPEVVEWQTRSDVQVITEYVYANPDQFAEFGKALEYTGIENILKVRGPFTLFLPTDEAMRKYYASRNISSITDMDLEAAEELIFNHFLKGRINTDAIGLGALLYKNSIRL